MLHVPSEKDIERYETDNPRIRRWLARVLRAIADDATRLPVLVHCVSGKDRTGVVVASVLSVLGAPREAIVAEYLLSEGEVRSEWIERALDGIGNADRYFHAVDLARLRRKLRALR
jgi:protein-tyrosine phosphatase